MFRGWRCSVISSGDIIIASGSYSLSSNSVGIPVESSVFVPCVTVIFIAVAVIGHTGAVETSFLPHQSGAGFSYLVVSFICYTPLLQ
jgi:hypothetical protein